MSNAILCDYCGETTVAASDDARDWIVVQYGYGRGERGSADFCTAACAVAGIEKDRDESAELLLSGSDEA